MTGVDWAKALQDWALLCPRCCAADLWAPTRQAIECAACKSVYPVDGGVAGLMNFAAEPDLHEFIQGYQKIRDAEGYTGRGAAFYRALPDYAQADADAMIWAIRRKSFAHFKRLLSGKVPADGQVLDLGSGNGWLSHHLSLLGYRPLALDINADRDDGLRALRHYPEPWPAVLSSFERLPLAAGSADMAVYNGTLHYSPDIAATVAEALRVLRSKGSVVIMDSPIYRDPSSGKAMLNERQTYHQERFGFATDYQTEGFLTWDGIANLVKRLECKLEVVRPWYGLRWALRPLKAKVLGTREPASFALIVLHRT